jgi:hypothetical protein
LAFVGLLIVLNFAKIKINFALDETTADKEIQINCAGIRCELKGRMGHDALHVCAGSPHD